MIGFSEIRLQDTMPKFGFTLFVFCFISASWTSPELPVPWHHNLKVIPRHAFIKKFQFHSQILWDQNESKNALMCLSIRAPEKH